MLVCVSMSYDQCQSRQWVYAGTVCFETRLRMNDDDDDDEDSQSADMSMLHQHTLCANENGKTLKEYQKLTKITQSVT